MRLLIPEPQKTVLTKNKYKNKNKSQLNDMILIYGQFYSHAYVNTWETWTRRNQPNAFKMGSDLNTRKPT